MQNFHLYLVPSDREGRSQSVLEAGHLHHRRSDDGHYCRIPYLDLRSVQSSFGIPKFRDRAGKCPDLTYMQGCKSVAILLRSHADMHAAVSAFTDFLLSLFPIYLLKDLKIDKHDKRILCVLMGFGLM